MNQDTTEHDQVDTSIEDRKQSILEALKEEHQPMKDFMTWVISEEFDIEALKSKLKNEAIPVEDRQYMAQRLIELTDNVTFFDLFRSSSKVLSDRLQLIRSLLY